MNRAKKAEEAVVVALAVVEVEVVAVALAVSEVEAGVVAMAVLLAVVMEIETQKQKFRVDVSVNNWKIDLQLQPLSGKSHHVGFPGNEKTTAYYKIMYIEISDGKVARFSLNLVLQCRNILDIGFVHVFKISFRKLF